jgi:hypothetical protein
MKTRILIAVGLGIVATLVLAGAAQVASSYGLGTLAEILFWPNMLLQRSTPCYQIGTPQHPFCEGTPLVLMALFESFLLSVVVYSVLAYTWLQSRSRRK